jgi:hypothetical protein
MRDGVGWRRDDVKRRHPTPLAEASEPPPPGEGKMSYDPAVVTPPSTTMVWPVMKLEASDER